MRRIKSHTSEKLEYVRKYIEGYLVATKKLPYKYYIDAFAGSGKCILCDTECNSRGGKRCLLCGRGRVVDGSVLISLKTKNKFSGYIFIEIIQNNIKNLEKIILQEFPEDRGLIKIKKADSNELLKNLYQHVSQYAGCLIFLDPEGPELFWNTVKYLSKIKKVELLILYPYDMSLVRLVKNFQEKLDKFYGNDEWFKIYNDKNNYNAEKRKLMLLDLYVNNLKKLGFEYVVLKQIRRNLRSGKSLYHLILATHHPAGKKIMEDIFNKELDGQQKINFLKSTIL